MLRFIIQSPSGPQDKPDRRGVQSCQPTEACLAAFLAAAKPYMYIYCQWDHGEDLLKETTFPEMDFKLGAPHGKAVQTSKDQWTRKFGDASKPTVVSWDNAKHTGSVKWAHEY